jgi:hypothetical protein
MRHEDKENLFLYQKPGRYPSYLGIRNTEKKIIKKAEYVHVGTMDGAWVSIIGS